MGLEEYQGMTLDQKLTTLCVKMENVEDMVRSRPQCPSSKCEDHAQRISKLEDHEKIVVGCVIIGIIGSGLLVWFLDKVFGGR